MKRIIYQPAAFEPIPPGAISVIMPSSGAAVDVIVSDDFITSGIILYDSLEGITLDESDMPVSHNFSGWEIL